MAFQKIFKLKLHHPNILKVQTIIISQIIKMERQRNEQTIKQRYQDTENYKQGIPIPQLELFQQDLPFNNRFEFKKLKSNLKDIQLRGYIKLIILILFLLTYSIVLTIIIIDRVKANPQNKIAKQNEINTNQLKQDLDQKILKNQILNQSTIQDSNIDKIQKEKMNSQDQKETLIQDKKNIVQSIKINITTKQEQYNKNDSIQIFSDDMQLQEAEKIRGIQKLRDIKQLPFCILIDTKSRIQEIIQSIKNQEYTNYRYINLPNELKQQNKSFSQHKKLISSKCLAFSIILYIERKIQRQTLKNLNRYHQNYDAWVTYVSQYPKKYQVVSFLYRIYQLLELNDFDGSNMKYLEKLNYRIMALGLLQLASIHLKEIKEVKLSSISLIKIDIAQKDQLSRTSYQKIFKLSQDFKINIELEEKMYMKSRRISYNSYLQLTPDKFHKAFQRQQLLYLSKNHSIAQIQKIQLSERFDIQRIRNHQKQTQFCVTILSNNNIPQNRYKKVLLSIFQQDYQSFHVVFFDDFSQDENLQKSIEFTRQYGFPHDRILFIKNQRRMFATYNILNSAFNYCEESQVQLLVDGDDQLIGTQAFSYLDLVYRKNLVQKQEKWIVYSNFKNSLYAYGTSQRLTSMERVIKQGKRQRAHFIGPIRSWKVKLVQNIPLSYHLNKTGGWFDTLYDDAIQHCLIQLAELTHTQYLPEILYQYNRDYGNNDNSNKQKKMHRARTYRWVLDFPPLKKLQNLEISKKQQEISKIFEKDKVNNTFIVQQW